VEDANDDDLAPSLSEGDHVAIAPYDRAAERPAYTSIGRWALADRIEAVPDTALEVVGPRRASCAIPPDGLD
jgi:hypothetical protein